MQSDEEKERERGRDAIIDVSKKRNRGEITVYFLKEI